MSIKTAHTMADTISDQAERIAKLEAERDKLKTLLLGNQPHPCGGVIRFKDVVRHWQKTCGQLEQKINDAEWVFAEHNAPDAPFLWHSPDGWRCSTYASAENRAPDAWETPWDAIRSAREAI